MGPGPQPPYDRTHHPFKEPWTVTFVEETRLFMLQLTSVGGSVAIAKSAVAPLERVKILLQVQHMKEGTLRYSGITDALKKISKEHGKKALWQGNVANIARIVPDVAFRFLAAEQIAVLFAPVDGGAPSTADRLKACAAAGALRTLLFYPLDLCRVRITADVAAPRQFRGLVGTAMSTLRREGVRGLYRGAPLSAALAAAQVYTVVSAYEALEKKLLPPGPERLDKTWGGAGVLGCAAGAAGATQIFLHPLDTVRRCQQLSGAQRHTVSYRGALDAAWSMAKKQGLATLYRGVSAGAVRAGMAAPIQLLTWDAIRYLTTALDPTSSVTSPL